MGVDRNRTDSILGDPRKTLLSMALPMLLAILVENLQTFVDGMWCSGLGAEALSAISISSCIYTMIVALGTGMAVGASASISKSIGAGDMRSAENAVPAIIAIVFGMSVLSSIAFWFLAEPIVYFVGQGQDIETCMEYIHPFLAMSFFLMMNSVWVGILRAEGASMICMGMSLMASGINIALDPVLIYSLDMGLEGAAVATCISYVAVTLVGFWYYLSGRTVVKMRFRGFSHNRKVIREMLSIGCPCALEMFVAPLLMIPQNAIVFSCGGSNGMVAYTYAFKFIDIALIPANAISKSLIPIISAEIGQKRPDKILESCRIAYRITLLVGFACMVVILIAANVLVELFMNSESMEAVRDEMVLAMRIFSLTCVFHTFRLVGTAILQATRHAVLSSALTLSREIMFLGTFYVASMYSMETIFWACDATNFTMMFVITVFAYRAVRKLVKEMDGKEMHLKS